MTLRWFLRVASSSGRSRLFTPPWLPATVFGMIPVAAVWLSAQTAPIAPPMSQQAETFRVLRVTAGPRGAEVGGEFRLDEERTTFSRLQDTQVVVFFQWEGVPGRHRFAGRWRSPDGGLSTIAEFEYDARDRRFGAHWTLPISPSIPLGKWSIEATIDGLPSGVFTFDIVEERRVPAVEPRRLLDNAQLYGRADSIFVVIERSTISGAKIDSAAGFFVASGHVATAFAAVDAADGLRLVLPNGETQAVTALATWNRRQDWALIPTARAAASHAPAAPAEATRVGDRCYSMEAGAGGTRILAECTIIGRSASTAGGTRLIVTFLNATGVPGAPVLNEFGEVLGVVGGALIPGPTSLRELLHARAELRGVPVVPLSLLPVSVGAEAVAVQELRRRGFLMPAVDREGNILNAGFAREIQRKPTLRAIDQRDEFSVRDSSLVVFVEWDPKERLRGAVVLRTYDEENHPLRESKPVKVNLKPGQSSFTYWDLSVPSRAGVYRVDVLLETTPIWRGFLRVND